MEYFVSLAKYNRLYFLKDKNYSKKVKRIIIIDHLLTHLDRKN